MNNGTTIEGGIAGGPFVLANGLQINSGAGGANVLFQFDSLGAPGSPGLEIQNSAGLQGFTSSIEGIVVTGSISGASTFALLSVDSSDSSTLAGLLPNGTYGQMGYGFSLSQALPNRANGSLAVNGSELDLVVSGLYSVAWTGAGANNNWNASGNFVQMGGFDQFNRFQPGDAVVFSDSAAVFTVSVTGAVSPSSMTFQNQSHAYTLTGTGNINTGTLSLTNSGTVIVENTNTFSGLTSIGPGSTLQLGNGTNGTDGQLTNSSILDNGALIYSLTGQQTVANPITGAGTLQLTGGAVTLTSTGNTFSGGTTISGGTLQLGNNTGAGFDGSLPGLVAEQFAPDLRQLRQSDLHRHDQRQRRRDEVGPGPADLGDCPKLQRQHHDQRRYAAARQRSARQRRLAGAVGRGERQQRLGLQLCGE